MRKYNEAAEELFDPEEMQRRIAPAARGRTLA
jgi:hypothetical protein